MKLKHCHNKQFFPKLDGELSFSTFYSKIHGRDVAPPRKSVLKTPRNSVRNILAESHFIKVVGKNIEITLQIKCFHETYGT